MTVAPAPFPAECHVEPDIWVERDSRQGEEPVDQRIAALALRQHGVVAIDQLRALGLGRQSIGHRLAIGRLHAIHRGIYAVGHGGLTLRGRWTAAVLACGCDAVLSHRAAAALWGLRESARIDVTVPGNRRRPSGSIVVHRSAIPADETTVVDGIPVTTIPRTLLDLAAVVSPARVARAAHEAEVRRLGDVLSLADIIERHPRRRGIATLRRLLAEGRLGSDVTHSELEARFLSFVAAEGLPRPDVGVHVAAGGVLVECDSVWPAQRLIVELDGSAVHGSATAFERDRHRDRVLAVEGWRVVRVTWRQLHRERAVLAADLRRLLTSARAALDHRVSR
jgi:hypothetical protein